jgi:putative phosphoesterase
MSRRYLSKFADCHVSSTLHIVGLISDTHGLIRPEALDALRESDIIIHCGDIGSPAVLRALRDLAPVRAIRGNNDKSAWAASLPTSDIVEVGTHKIYVLHNLTELNVDPAVSGFSAVVSGHSHKPLIQRQGRCSSSTPAAPVRGDSICR